MSLASVTATPARPLLVVENLDHSGGSAVMFTYCVQTVPAEAAQFTFCVQSSSADTVQFTYCVQAAPDGVPDVPAVFAGVEGDSVLGSWV